MESVVELIDFVVTRVNDEVVREGSLSAQLASVAKVVDTVAFRKRFAGEDASSQEYFDESVAGLIHDAFNQAPK